MSKKQQLVLASAVERIAGKAKKDLAADVKAQLYEEGNDGATVKIGSQRVHINLYSPSSKELVGEGEEFIGFMREHGMVREVVDDEWKKCIVVAGKNVLWEETGEVVPGASVQIVEKADYVKVERFNAEKVLAEAREAGMLDSVTLPMLEGGNYGDR